MGIEISITRIRSTWKRLKFHQNSRHSSFSVYLSFVWDFEDARIFYSEMWLYIVTRVDPLTSILAVLARSCQILTTSWQPWIPWQDSY